jgi:hypothetical protein
MSAPLNDGGPAFPNFKTDPFSSKVEICPQGGMTLRDWFAGQALTSVLESSGDLQSHYDFKAGSSGDNNIPSPYAIATFSYALADAMLAARREAIE